MENRLRKLRKQENKTLLQVARFLSISTQSLSAYETGVRDLSTDILCKLADFYGVSVDYILCRDNSAPAPVYRYKLQNAHNAHIWAAKAALPYFCPVIHLYALVASALTELKYATAATFELL